MTDQPQPTIAPSATASSTSPTFNPAAMVLPSGQIAPITMALSGLGVIPPGEQAKYSQLGIRYNRDAHEQKWVQERAVTGWEHRSPMSVLVCVIGQHWRERSWARVADMVEFTNNSGYPCALIEIQDRCFQPYDALGTMRNEAIQKARQGWEYLCMVDSDVLPQPDVLVRMMNHADREGRPIVVPFVEEPGTQKPLHGPEQKKFTGSHKIRWSVLSFLLFRTGVFNPYVDGRFWDNAIGADEGYHFQRLHDIGHSISLMTDVVVPTQSAPTYPLTTQRLSQADFNSFWQQKKEWIQKMPDRRPIDPADPRVREGIYLPFHKPPCQNMIGTARCGTEMQKIDLPDGVAFKCPKCSAPKEAASVPTPATV